MYNESFDDCLSVDSYLATSGVNTVKELSQSHVGAMDVEEEDSEPEPEVVPNCAVA
jgi:hypothetical protein